MQEQMQERLQERMRERLEVLKREFETGQAQLGELEAQQLRLRETLLRISGAIQVIEELTAPEPSAKEGNGTDPPDGGMHAGGRERESQTAPRR